MFRSKGSRSIFTNRMCDIPRNLLFPRPYYNDTGTIETSSITIDNVINDRQYALLQKIHDSYTVLLANKQYENISSNYDQYIFLLHQLREINVSDSTLQLLINITEETLTGSVNMYSLYEAYMYNELQILLLNKRIEDILSDKNMVHTIMDGIEGRFSLTKCFKLSPILSYYIHLYGVPAYGVGFDPDKLVFLQKLLNTPGHTEPNIINTNPPDHRRSIFNSTDTNAGSTINFEPNVGYVIEKYDGEVIDFYSYTDEINVYDAYTGEIIYGLMGTPAGFPLWGTTGTGTGEIWNTRNYTDFPIYQFNVSNAFQVLFDVRKFNTLLGLTKDASNIQILSSSYDISSDSFANNSITLPFTDFFSQINSNTIISIGSLIYISTDFNAYIDTFYNEINLSTIYSLPSNFNPFNGISNTIEFITSLITSLLSSIDSSGVVSKSINWVVVSGLDGNINIPNINGLLRYAVQTNAFGNRIPDSTTYSSYGVFNGFLANDLIYIPDGLKIILNVCFTYLTGDIKIISSKTYNIPLLLRLSNLT